MPPGGGGALFVAGGALRRICKPGKSGGSVPVKVPEPKTAAALGLVSPRD